MEILEKKKRPLYDDMESKILKLTNEEFTNLVKSSLNISEVLFKLGYTTVDNSWRLIKKRMDSLNLSGKNFRGKEPIKGKAKEVNPEDLFKEGCNHQRHVLRNYILRHNIIPYKCAICGISEWQGKPLSLELDHINGINNDNRLENLRFLCPNCHSQTVTYAARNKQQTESKYELSEELKDTIVKEYIQLKSQSKVAEKLGIAQKAIKQALSEIGIDKPNQKYVIQYDKNHNEIQRFGCIAECCNYLMNNNFVKTRLLKTCRATLNKNAGTLWKGFYFELINS